MGKVGAPSVSRPFVTERACEFNRKLSNLVSKYQDVDPSQIVTMLRCSASAIEYNLKHKEDDEK